MAIGYLYENDENDENLIVHENLVIQAYGFEWPCEILDSPPVKMMGRVD